jgi:hypothetical protein
MLCLCHSSKLMIDFHGLLYGQYAIRGRLNPVLLKFLVYINHMANVQAFKVDAQTFEVRATLAQRNIEPGCWE